MKLPRLLDDGRKSLMFLLVFIGIAQGLLAISGAWLIMTMFERHSSNSLFPGALFASLILTIVLNALLRRSERIQAEKIGQHYAMSIRMRLFSRLLRSNPRKLQQMRNGNILLRFVGDLSALRQWVSLGLSRLIVAGLAMLLAMVALAWLYWPFALGVVCVLLISGAWVVFYSHRIRAAVTEARKRQANLAANVSEKIVNLPTIQACGQADRERRFVRRQSKRLIEAALARAGRIGSLRAVVEASTGATAAVVFGLAFSVEAASLSPGLLVAVITILGFLAPSLRDIGRVHEYWLASRVARDKLQTISRRMPRLQSGLGNTSLELKTGSIEFKRVTVNGVFKDVCLTVPGGSRLAISGDNGCGKSTLLGLAGRLFDPDSGFVTIDGLDLRQISDESLRHSIAFVSADLPLLRGTLKKNLTYGVGKFSDEALMQRISRSGLEPLMWGLPKRLDTRIRNAGLDLSHGQRMRIALVRAMLKQPRILLLDEADSHLDVQGVDALVSILKSFTGTLLMVTHRQSLLSVCTMHFRVNREGGIDAMTGTQMKESGPLFEQSSLERASVIPFVTG